MNPETGTFWLMVVLFGAGTWAIRSSFLLFSGRLKGGGLFERALRFIPSAVLPALLVPGVVFGHGGEWCVENTARIAAALAAGAAGWKTGNVLVVIGTGMAVLWSVRVFVGF